MENDKYQIQDLINAAAQQKPIDFEQAFGDLIVDRLQNAIQDKKIQIAQQMYGYETNNAED
jgi:hypothetical protein